jgi:hypothetical protein
VVVSAAVVKFYSMAQKIRLGTIHSDISMLIYRGMVVYGRYNHHPLPYHNLHLISLSGRNGVKDSTEPARAGRVFVRPNSRIVPIVVQE